MTHIKLSVILLAATTAISLASFEPALANRRHFAYNYESAVLPKGGKEIEIWNTLRTDKGSYFRGMEHRAELELGLGGSFQTSLYLNLESNSMADGDGIATSGTEFSVSNEWKYSLSNPTADIIGSALYGEWTLKYDETELEGKVILDKQIGNVLIAANATIEHEAEGRGSGSENKIEFTAGVAYLLDEHFSFGLEARHHTVVPDNDEIPGTSDESYGALFVGPTLTYGDKGWWAAFSVMPQIGLGSNKANTNSPLELIEHEKVEARLLLSFEL